MGIGLGIVFIVVGLVLVTGAVDLPASVDDVIATDLVGWILLAAGVLAIVLALVTTQRARTTRVEEHRADGY